MGEGHEQTEWRILAYRDAAGSSPVEAYVASLPEEVRRRFQTRVGYLCRDGLNASQEVAKKLEDDLWELRLPHSDGNPRILFFASIGRRLVLLHGFNKQGRANDKVPESEKIIARRRRDDFLKRDALEREKAAQAAQKKRKGKR